MTLKCEKGCGKCCEVGGTGMQLIASESEALALAAHTGKKMDYSAGRNLSELVFFVKKAAPCPFYDMGACTAYEHRPRVCRAYQCDGKDQWVKSEQSFTDSVELASKMVTHKVSDLRSWFPEPIANALARHENIAFQFSGGKDSTALLMSMREFWDMLTVYHLDTGDMHPETSAVVEQVSKMVPKFVRVQSDVFSVKTQFGLPSDIIPWTSTAAAHAMNSGSTVLMQDRVSCCYRTTMLPLHQRMKDDGVTLIIRGQKNRDSLKGTLFSGDVMDGFEFLYPASDWTDEQCFQIMRDHGIPVPRYYTEGLVHSGDCMGCTGWCSEENRPNYLKTYHPERYPAYRADLLEIASALHPQISGILKVANECL